MASTTPLSLLAALAVASGLGCGDPPAPTGLVYWLYPNGSEVMLKLSLSKPQVPF